MVDISNLAYIEVTNMKPQDVFDKMCRDEWLQLIHQWVHNEVDRKMLERKYLDGICFEALSEEFDMTPNNCEKRVKKARKQLFNHLKIT